MLSFFSIPVKNKNKLLGKLYFQKAYCRIFKTFGTHGQLSSIVARGDKKYVTGIEYKKCMTCT